MTTSRVGVLGLHCCLCSFMLLAGIWVGVMHCAGVVSTTSAARGDGECKNGPGLAFAILEPGDLGVVRLLVASLKKRPESSPPQLHFSEYPPARSRTVYYAN